MAPGAFRRPAWMLLLLLAGAAASCSSYSERYFVGVTEDAGTSQFVPAQFYRFDLSGYSWCQRTEFQSGWYDKDSVDVLFSEVVTEASLRNAATGGAKAPTAAVKPLPKDSPPPPDHKRYVVFGPEGERINGDSKRFLIMVTSNPKAISDEIQAISENQEFARNLAELIQKDERRDAVEARANARKAAAPHQAVKSAVDVVQADAKALLGDANKLKALTPADLAVWVDRLLNAAAAK